MLLLLLSLRLLLLTIIMIKVTIILFFCFVFVLWLIATEPALCLWRKIEQKQFGFLESIQLRLWHSHIILSFCFVLWLLYAQKTRLSQAATWRNTTSLWQPQNKGTAGRFGASEKWKTSLPPSLNSKTFPILPTSIWQTPKHTVPANWRWR